MPRDISQPIVWRPAPSVPARDMAAIRAAFTTWAEATGRRVRWKRGEEASVELCYGNDLIPGVGGPFAAYCHNIAVDGTIRRSVIQVTRTTYLVGGVALTRLMMHEIGHALGLSHSMVKDDVMYPDFHGDAKLTANDLFAFRALYGGG